MADDPTVQPFTPVIHRTRKRYATDLEQTLSGMPLSPHATPPLYSQTPQTLAAGGFTSASTFFRLARELKDTQVELERVRADRLQQLDADRDRDGCSASKV
jgi:hypothetical protein